MTKTNRRVRKLKDKKWITAEPSKYQKLKKAKEFQKQSELRELNELD